MSENEEAAESKRANEVLDPFTAPAPPLDMKTIVGLLTLAPLRLIMIGSLLALTWITSTIGGWGRWSCPGLLGMDVEAPARGWRRRLQHFNFGVWRWVLLLSTLLLSFLAGVALGGWPKVEGQPAPWTSAPSVVIAPHTSLVDMWVLYWCAPASLVMRAEDRHMLFIGTILR